MKPAFPRWLALFAAVVPPALAYLSITHGAEAQRAKHGWACGTPAIGDFLLACLASGAISLLAAGYRVRAVGWRKSFSSWPNVLELAALLLPFVAACGCALPVFCE